MSRTARVLVFAAIVSLMIVNWFHPTRVGHVAVSLMLVGAIL